MQDDLSKQLESLTVHDLALLEWELRWRQQARPNQLAPEGLAWSIWLALAGRGFGKTRMAAEWSGQTACRLPKGSVFGVIAPTHDDLEKTCFEGPSGLLQTIPYILVKDYNKTDSIITLWNDVIIRGFSAEKPDRLRGPNLSGAWTDEAAAWVNGEDVWDMLMMCLRIGHNPRVVVTTTPRPTPFVKMLISLPNVVITRGTTYDNKENLSPAFFRNISKYEGTQLGKQELEGEIIDMEDMGVVKRKQFRLWPAKKPLPRFEFIVMSLDTAFTEKAFDKKKQEQDPSGCVVMGVFSIDEDGEQRDEWAGDKHLTKHIMVLDCWQEYYGLPELIRRVKREMKFQYGEADKPLISPYYGQPKITQGELAGREPDIVIIEDKGSGKSLRQMLAAENLFTWPYNPGNADKLQRLHAVTPVFAAGRVWVVESDKKPGEPRTWAEPLISQVCTFRGEGTTKHDEFVDCISQGLRYLYDNFLLTTSKQEPKNDSRVEVGWQNRIVNPYMQ